MKQSFNTTRRPDPAELSTVYHGKPNKQLNIFSTNTEITATYMHCYKMIYASKMFVSGVDITNQAIFKK